MSKRDHRQSGFTLIELLIVIAIIGILAGLAMTGISTVRQSANEALTKQTISGLANALESYKQDEGEFPGIGDDIDEETNQFPILFNALFGERKPNGPGGRSAPYLPLKEDMVVVYDEDLDEYRMAKRGEIYDDNVEKFLADAWGNPMIYRCNKGQKYEPYMHQRHGADIYSVGEDEIDQTKEGDHDNDNDDIGNW